MKILFICKHNRFRSKVAEALMRKYSKNEIKSAGMRLDFTRAYVAENVKKVLEERQAKVKDEASRLVNDFDLRWADKILIVADNVASEDFPKEKTEVWKIEDADENNLDKIREIVEKIEKRVKDFLER